MEIPTDCRIYDLTCYWTWMGAGGIARTKEKPQAEITLKESLENSIALTDLYNGKNFSILIESPLSRIIGNFFMGLNKPSVPAKLFNNEQDAIAWLKQYV